MSQNFLSARPSLSDQPRSENWISWDIEHPALDETLIAGCATYKAFARFLGGKDLFILPRTRDELASVLYVNTQPFHHFLWPHDLTDGIYVCRQRYAKDSIHNTISGARNALQPGGYTRVSPLHLAYDYVRDPSPSLFQIIQLSRRSILRVLDTDDNASVLLSLHAQATDYASMTGIQQSSGRPIASGG